MTHDSQKSDPCIVALKLANKLDGLGAELVERRRGAKGNRGETHTCRTQGRESVSTRLNRVRERAKAKRKERFTALFHYLDVDLLRWSYRRLKRDAAPGVDRQTWTEYGEQLEGNLVELHARLHRGAYRALPSKRTYIPKLDGRQRPLGIAALEDKIVQRAVVEVLNAIYEEDFQGFSYGFRPGRSQHNALDALAVGIKRTKVSWIADIDVERFFDSMSHEWLVKFLKHRIGDSRVIRLICKWLKAGVMEDGVLEPTEAGTPQGAVISPLLANIYLHYVFDLWAIRWRHRAVCGNVIFVRYADDIVAGFQYESEAKRFVDGLRSRMRQFSLSLHSQKTRLIEFGRFAVENRAYRGLRKPETFNFLGFTHICSCSRAGYFQLRRITRRDRMRTKLREVQQELRRRMHGSIEEQGRWLRRVVSGYFAYHAVPTNSERVRSFRFRVIDHWRRTLRRRSQKDHTTWERMDRLTARWLPQPRILHPWPEERFFVNHPRWEPSA